MRERHTDAARDLIYAEAVDREVWGLPNPASHAERVYAAEQEGFSPMSAHAVALRAGGWDKEADIVASAAVDRAKLLRRRDLATLPNDPSVLRGDISACRKWGDVERVRPSITLPAGMLRSLVLSGPELRASDLMLFWLLYALSIGSGVSTLSFANLKALAGAADHGRLRAALARLNGMRISLVNEPSIVRRRWINDEAGFRAELTDASVAWAFSSSFVREAKVERGGPRFAHLSIVAVRSFNAVGQERLYRAILAAATECGAWRGPGGAFVWRMTPEHLATLAGLAEPDVKLLRRERVMPLAKRLAACNDRICIDGMEVGERDRAAPGKPASRIDLLVTISAAAEIERSKTARLLEEFIGAGGSPPPTRIIYVGPGGETEREKKSRRKAERLAAAEVTAPQPISPSVIDQVEQDEIEAVFAAFMETDEPEPGIGATMGAMRASELNLHLTGGATLALSVARQAAPPKMPKPSERRAARQLIEAHIRNTEVRAVGELNPDQGQEDGWWAMSIGTVSMDLDDGHDAEKAPDADEQEDDEPLDEFGPEMRSELDAEMWEADLD